MDVESMEFFFFFSFFAVMNNAAMTILQTPALIPNELAEWGIPEHA